jgi:hypothetical protein
MISAKLVKRTIYALMLWNVLYTIINYYWHADHWHSDEMITTDFCITGTYAFIAGFIIFLERTLYDVWHWRVMLPHIYIPVILGTFSVISILVTIPGLVVTVPGTLVVAWTNLVVLTWIFRLYTRTTHYWDTTVSRTYIDYLVQTGRMNLDEGDRECRRLNI